MQQNQHPFLDPPTIVVLLGTKYFVYSGSISDFQSRVGSGEGGDIVKSASLGIRTKLKRRQFGELADVALSLSLPPPPTTPMHWMYTRLERSG